MADFIKFLGTAGARVVLSKQLRASGGIWLCIDNTNLYIDPGPGALVHGLSSRPKMDPAILDAILLSHKHLDHSGDINVMIEAMTEGTKKKRGLVFAPKEALDTDPVIFKYVRGYPEKIIKLQARKKYKVKNISFVCPIKNIHHGAEAYGFKIYGKKHTIGYMGDTKYFDGLVKAYSGCDILILNVLSTEPRPFDHLDLENVKALVKKLRPKTTIMTHFGMLMLKAKPWLVAEALSKELKANIIAASDGMTFNL